MTASVKLVGFGLATLAAWLAAQCVLTVWHGPSTPAQRMVDPAARMELLTQHWTREAVQSRDAGLPLTTLELTWIGGLRADPVDSTVVVLGYQKQQRTLTQGQRLAPGIVLHRIDDQGLVFDHNGRLERLPWPQERPPQGLKRHG
ncbi:pilus assembly protein PilZ [Stutzerimonas zhaodongensis]|uniref:pilus assembly protein PilZ n=1 Tax=Stutzerimonas TaxID=2901164 RepID=UPI00388F7C73